MNMTDQQPDTTPRCPSCGTPWSDHADLTEMCRRWRAATWALDCLGKQSLADKAEIERLNAELRMLTSDLRNERVEAKRLRDEVELKVARYAKMCQYSSTLKKMCQYSSTLKAEIAELKAELKRRDERHNEKDRGKPTGA